MSPSKNHQWRKPVSRLQLAASFLGVLIATLHLFASAQDFPNRPIKLVVPFPAGGGVDAVARTIAEKLAIELKQPVIVDNKGGAGGALGAGLVARSAADGYTLLFANNGQAVLPHLQKIDWDPIKDFKPVSSVATYAMVVLVNSNSPIKTIPDLIQAAKAQPGRITYGSSGLGGPLHLGTEMFRSAAAIDIVHVPYKGNAPMTLALLGQEISMSMDTLAVSLPHIKSGKFRALAVTSQRRMTLLPDVPTIREVAIPDFDYEGWQAVFAPANTPAPMVAKLNAALNKVIGQPSVSQRLIELGYEPKPSTEQELGTLIAKDLLVYKKVIQEANIKAE
ncbi:MAG: tripartite tricarboxylate transporter substrate binding protein [Betaproteobacteria bacterium]|nr:tripartite tricarboxylate transporter substrate binding protein [Betaproteobacteria bacterium]